MKMYKVLKNIKFRTVAIPGEGETGKALERIIQEALILFVIIHFSPKELKANRVKGDAVHRHRGAHFIIPCISCILHILPEEQVIEAKKVGFQHLPSLGP